SQLNRWRALLNTWAGLRDALPPSCAVTHEHGVLTLRRGSLTVQVNFGHDPASLDDPSGQVLWRSQPGIDTHPLRPGETIWLQRPTQAR
ncbi:DUF3459 domain-containing protein, partial [Ruania albidiflava]|uniref:DUF3459 domain-containing protein n=1 Tax=Ruania albidiflava TaxID=366586 RepID=UPI0023F553CD